MYYYSESAFTVLQSFSPTLLTAAISVIANANLQKIVHQCAPLDFLQIGLCNHTDWVVFEAGYLTCTTHDPRNPIYVVQVSPSCDIVAIFCKIDCAITPCFLQIPLCKHTDCLRSHRIFCKMDAAITLITACSNPFFADWDVQSH